MGIPFFLQKEAKRTKRGPGPPLLKKKGAPAIVFRGSRQNLLKKEGKVIMFMLDIFCEIL
jgi:hypothetical protein